MNSKLRALLAVILFVCAFTDARAQEVQVPVDREDRIDVIDADLAAEAGLFQEYPGFMEARLFRLPDDEYELVIQYHEDGQTLRVREELTDTEVANLRARVSEALAARVPVRAFDDGRWKMLTTTSIFGAIHGALIPLSLGVTGRAVEALPPLGAALGFGIPFYLTTQHPVNQAEATMVLYGSMQGLSHGAFLSFLVAGEDVGRGALGVMSLGSIAQGLVGYQMANRWDMPAGSAEGMAYGSLLGHGYGFGLAVLALGETDDFEDAVRLLSASVLATSVVGAYGGYHLAQRQGYTQGDSRINLLAGFLGLQTATTALYLADVEEPRPFAALSMVGTSAGLFAGMHLVREHNFTRGQSSLIGLGTTAGGLLGGSIATLVDAGPRAASALSLLGSVGGFGFSYALLSDEARIGAGGDLRISINPFGGVTPVTEPGSIRPALQVNYQF